ncbi:hypothetical protein, partial [Pseudomonas helleri]
STGMIELTPDQVNSIVVDMRSGLPEQQELSSKVRSLENKYLETLLKAEDINREAAQILS